MTGPEKPADAGLALLRSLVAASSSKEGRALLRQLVDAIELAREEAEARDPVESSVDAAYARALRSDRQRARAARGRK